jgi:peptidoglycan hydrolase-like protein with peptidoglycan-binding domain
MTQRLCAKATQNPVDACAVLAAVAISMIIIVNAAFLQSAGHPAPYVANANAKPQAAVTTTTTVAVRPIVAPGAPPAVVPQQMAMRHADPIADLIGPSPRIAAAQKVLSDYGYGQIKPTGSLDDATSAAIEKFEREHKLPVTGRVSDRLMSGLASLAGHPIE